MRWKIIAISMITVICLVWSLWGLHFHDFYNSLKTFNVMWFLAALGIYTSNFFLRALRFQLLLETKLPYKSMLSLNAIGFAAINVIPLRLGEWVRPALLDDKHGVSWGTSLAAVVLERLLDFIAMLTLLLLVSTTVKLPSQGVVVKGINLLAWGQKLSTVLVIIGLLGLLLISVFGHRFLRLVKAIVEPFFPKLAKQIDGMGEKFITAFQALLFKPIRAISSVVLTLAIWLCTILTAACFIKGFRHMPFSYDILLFNWSSTMVGILALPSPGFFGGFELASVESLKLMGVKQSAAQAYALSLHFFIFLHTLALGAVFLLREGISLFQVVRRGQEKNRVYSSETIQAADD